MPCEAPSARGLFGRLFAGNCQRVRGRCRRVPRGLDSPGGRAAVPKSVQPGESESKKSDRPNPLAHQPPEHEQEKRRQQDPRDHGGSPLHPAKDAALVKSEHPDRGFPAPLAVTRTQVTTGDDGGRGAGVLRPDGVDVRAVFMVRSNSWYGGSRWPTARSVRMCCLHHGRRGQPGRGCRFDRLVPG